MRDDETLVVADGGGTPYPAADGPRVPPPPGFTPPRRKPIDPAYGWRKFLADLHAAHPGATEEHWEDLRDAMEASSTRPLFRDSEERPRRE